MGDWHDVSPNEFIHATVIGHKLELYHVVILFLPKTLQLQQQKWHLRTVNILYVQFIMYNNTLR